jgi:serine/threonine protein kinase
MFKPGTVIAKRYRIDRRIAGGGMGAVLAATHLRTGRAVALKAMLPTVTDTEAQRARFLDEATISTRIPSDHIARIDDAGVDDDSGVPWIAMELLDGEDLATRLKREGALDVAAVAALAEELGEALGAAHDAGVVHLDLKPENLFLAKVRQRGRDEMLKVLDFGISRVLDAHRTHTLLTQGMGTPGWLAPEQCSKGGRVSVRTDVWPLGLLAFWCLSGHELWHASRRAPDNVAAFLVEMMVQEIPRASARAAELGAATTLPTGFDDWFARCVDRDPAQRFANGREAMEALSAVLRAPSIPPTETFTPRAPIFDAPAPKHGAVGATVGVPELLAAKDADPKSHVTGMILGQMEAEARGDLDAVIALGETILVALPALEEVRRRTARAYTQRVARHRAAGRTDAAREDAARAMALGG